MSLKLMFLTAAATLIASPAAGIQISGSGVDPGVQANDAGAEAGHEAEAGPVTALTAADVRAGMPVLDTEGGQVGTIESVEADGAIVATGEARAKLPFASFGRSEQGLVITMTRSELEAAVQAHEPS
jgi:hypothetical protein